MSASATETKPRWLRFRDRYLPLVRAGTKTTTIRKQRLVRNLKSGDELLLAFGNYARPTMMRAVCTAIEPMALFPEGALPIAGHLLDDFARRDGITRAELEAMLADPEPHVIIHFTLAD